MTDLAALRAKSIYLENQIKDQLQKRKEFATAAELSSSNKAFQHQTQLKVMREKLQSVISSRKRANENNRKLLADFDRIQKHLHLMDEKTERLVNNIDNHKRYLDCNFPNWREKAALITSPNYIDQENVFNLLDSLRCRLDDDKAPDFKSFNSKTFTLDEQNEGLVHLLDPVSGDINPKLFKSESKASITIEREYEKENEKRYINRTSSNPSYTELSISEPFRETKPKPVNSEPVHRELIVKQRVQDTETFTNITESERSIPLSPSPESLYSELVPSVLEDANTEDTITPRNRPKKSPSMTSYLPKDPLQDPKLYTSHLGNVDLSSDSEDDIENMLNPGSNKTLQSSASSKAISPRTFSPKLMSPKVTSPRDPSPKQISPKISSPKISSTQILSKQDSDEMISDSETSVTPLPMKRRNPLAALNESSGSEINLNNERTENDSEDDFDFFD